MDAREFVAPVSASERRVLKNIGRAEGSIIATIIASHMSRKAVAEPTQVWPCIRIHIMDIVQPPGISISQHIERQKYTVAATLTMKVTELAEMNPRGWRLLRLSTDSTRCSPLLTQLVSGRTRFTFALSPRPERRHAPKAPMAATLSYICRCSSPNPAVHRVFRRGPSR